MSGIITAATISTVGAGISANAASKASKRSARASGKQLAFEQEKYDDWQETYGPIEDNLAEYYNSLTPEYYEVQGLEAFEKEKAVSFQQLSENLAQRGITDSGVAAGAEQSFALESAQTRAQIRTAAPAQAAEEKLRFLRVGLGQNPGASLSQTLAQRSETSAIEAESAGRSAGKAIQSAVTAIGTGISDYRNQEVIK